MRRKSEPVLFINPSFPSLFSFLKAIKANDVAQQEEKHAREAAKARHEEGEMRKREKEERELRIMEWKEEQKKKEEEERVRTQQEEERRVAEEKERELRHRVFTTSRSILPLLLFPSPLASPPTLSLLSSDFHEGEVERIRGAERGGREEEV